MLSQKSVVNKLINDSFLNTVIVFKKHRIDEYPIHQKNEA